MYGHERSLVKNYQNRPFALIGVNSDSPAALPGIKKKQNITWRSFAAGRGGGSIAPEWNVKGWPTVLLIDHEGKIHFRDHGAPPEALIEQLVTAAEGT